MSVADVWIRRELRARNHANSGPRIFHRESQHSNQILAHSIDTNIVNSVVRISKACNLENQFILQLQRFQLVNKSNQVSFARGTSTGPYCRATEISLHHQAPGLLNCVQLIFFLSFAVWQSETILMSSTGCVLRRQQRTERRIY